jgi:pyrroline-5-carboxylate reductase
MGTRIVRPVALIGGGVMGEAFVRGLLRQALCEPREIVVSDPVAARRAELAAQLGVRTTASNSEAVSGAGVVILAVKPQALGEVLAGLDGPLHADALALSIVAGATLDTLRRGLASEAIVRVMPNTPGQIGQGISVWTATPETTPVQRAQAQAIVGALGREVYVDNEAQIDMATALSGSGPAYVLLFIEALTDAGVWMGFTRPVAEELALQTVIGSGLYMREAGLHPAALRNRVTSPGGTTAEALQVFEEGAFRALVSRAVMAAYRKARALGEATRS